MILKGAVVTSLYNVEKALHSNKNEGRRRDGEVRMIYRVCGGREIRAVHKERIRDLDSLVV